jgi:hypothetical protein
MPLIPDIGISIAEQQLTEAHQVSAHYMLIWNMLTLSHW